MDEDRHPFRNAFIKAAFATMFFAIVHSLYNIELVRNTIEDIGFDMTSGFVFQSREQVTESPHLLLFGFDDLYMREHGLFDENNQTDYGYVFPRERIADFIRDFDTFCDDIEPENLPQALFIDYDMSFTSEPYGKELSDGDRKLLDVLKDERPYTILLPKTRRQNFVEHSGDPFIRQRIEEEKIVFVAVDFLTASDGTTRRYLSWKRYKGENSEAVYPNVDIALWQLAERGAIDRNAVEREFKERDIIANRFFVKAYREEYADDMCQTSYSYWDRYTKYSASCSPYEIIEEEFAGALVMLGGTYRDNHDRFSVLHGGGNSVKGVELHANTLMTLFYLDGNQLRQLGFWPSVLLVFVLFFMVDLLIGYLFRTRLLHNERLDSIIVLVAYSASRLQFIIVLVVITAVMFVMSAYLLHAYAIWFNWFVPVVLFQLFDTVSRTKMKIDRYRRRKDDKAIDS